MSDLGATEETDWIPVHLTNLKRKTNRTIRRTSYVFDEKCGTFPSLVDLCGLRHSLKLYEADFIKKQHYTERFESYSQLMFL